MSAGVSARFKTGAGGELVDVSVGASCIELTLKLVCLQGAHCLVSCSTKLKVHGLKRRLQMNTNGSDSLFKPPRQNNL